MPLIIYILFGPQGDETHRNHRQHEMAAVVAALDDGDRAEAELRIEEYSDPLNLTPATPPSRAYSHNAQEWFERQGSRVYTDLHRHARRNCPNGDLNAGDAPHVFFLREIRRALLEERRLRSILSDDYQFWSHDRIARNHLNGRQIVRMIEIEDELGQVSHRITGLVEELEKLSQSGQWPMPVAPTTYMQALRDGISAAFHLDPRMVVTTAARPECLPSAQK